jgi:RNA polymerase sigma-70 factor (ECF subfamily)
MNSASHAISFGAFATYRSAMQGTREPPPTDFGVLIKAVANTRDREAFGLLFDHFAPRLKAYLQRAGAPASVAEDFAQEAMLVVWRKAGLYDPARAGASAWIFTIARNLRTDALRQQMRGAVASAGLDWHADSPVEPDTVLIDRDQAVRIEQALAALSEEQSRVIRLSFFSDKPHAEIARELDLPLGTVKSRLRLAMARLREILADLR